MDQSPLPNPDDTSYGTNSLEDPSTVIEPATTTSSGSTDASNPTTSPSPSTDSSTTPTTKLPRQKLGDLFRRFNVYLLLFVFVILLAAAVAVVAFLNSRKLATAPTISSQTLTQQQLAQVANNDVTVGTNKQVLNIESNAVFGGQVLIKQDLEVAGTIKAGGTLNLPGITVSGASSFAQLQTSSLNVSGNTSIQGSLTVAGAANFNSLSVAQLTVSGLNLNGDLTLNHHIVGGGPVPTRSSGTALGNGGTVSLSGSDTSGSISINTGNSPAAGCFLTVIFTQKFSGTPHVVVTPVGSSAASLGYYVTRSATDFSVCTATNPPASASFGFDYIIFD